MTLQYMDCQLSEMFPQEFQVACSWTILLTVREKELFIEMYIPSYILQHILQKEASM